MCDHKCTHMCMRIVVNTVTVYRHAKQKALVLNLKNNSGYNIYIYTHIKRYKVILVLDVPLHYLQ
jgi:hypothetical protein